MPISRKEWETGKIEDEIFKTTKNGLLEFLRTNPNCAYTKKELIDELLAMKLKSLTEMKKEQLEPIVESALDRLSEDGLIKEKIIKVQEYYIIAKG